MDEGISERAEVAVIDLTRTREHERIRLQQQSADSEESRFTRFFKRKAVDTDTHLLSYGQLLIFLIVLQVPVNQLYWYIKMSRESGGINALISQIITTVVVHFPLFVLYSTMAYYSKMGYVKFWDCLPICQGLSYTTLLVTLLMEVNNISGAGIVILYVYETFYGVPWKDCNFKGADKNCIPHNPNYEVPLNNCEFASYQFNKYNMRNLYYNGKTPWYNLGSVKVNWTIAIWFCCFIVCVPSMLGFKKCSAVLFKLLMIALFGFAAPVHFVTTVYCLINNKKIFSMFKDYQHFFSARVWVQGILLNLPSNSPGILIYLSSVSPENMKHPLATASKVFLGKILLYTLFMTWYAQSADQMLTIYNVQNIKCLDNIDMLQFTVFTDVLANLPLPFIWLNLHYIVLLIVHIITTIIAVTATVNSLCQAMPSLNRNRFRTCAIICFAIGCASTLTTTEGAMAFNAAISRKLSIVYLVINVIALIGIVFVYGIKTLKDDILFTYRSVLTPMLWSSSSLLPILLLLTFANIVRYDLQKHKILSIHTYIDTILCLPLLLFPVYQIIKNAVGKNPQPLFRPKKTWGVERKLRKARKQFNPDKAVEYNSSKLHCDHYCLVSSTRYKREIFSQTMLYQSLLTEIVESKHRKNTSNND